MLPVPVIRHRGPHKSLIAINLDLRELQRVQVNRIRSWFSKFLAGQQLKTQSKIEKEACEFKSRVNRKQFEFNPSVDAILTDIATKADSPDEVKRLADEGKEKIRKRQKLVKLADRNKDGWLVVQEYESDDLASNSKDEKKIKKAKTAAEKKRKDARPHGTSGNPFKRSKISRDNQLFRGKTFSKCLCRACPSPKILC